MKAFFLILGLVWLSLSFAQTDTDIVVVKQNSTDSLFLFLDKTKMITEILLDKVQNIFNIEEFDGINNVVCDYNKFKQFYLDIFNSSINTPKIDSIQYLKKSRYYFMSLNNNAIPISFIYYNYIK